MLLLILGGPTAVGKSDLALDLAEHLNAEILCADSMQVYRLMDIGTAKPTPDERARIPHHLLDLVYPDQPFSAARYAEEFGRVAAQVYDRGHLPLVVGGTGLYIRSAVRPLLFPDVGARPECRSRLAAQAEIVGSAGLHARLAAVDPKAAGAIHPNDLRRIIRALEVYETTGRPISAWRDEPRRSSPDYDPIYVCLTRNRDELYQRIELRTDRMIAAGFPGEVRALLDAGYGRNLPSMQGLGYRELAAHLSGESTLAEAVGEIKRRTRNYAKRQLTWFRHEPYLHWLDLSRQTSQNVRAEILRLLAGRWQAPSNS